MRDNVYVELQPTIHFSNRSGVRAKCPDCHVPHNWTDKIARKMQASKEVWGKVFGTIDTREKFEAHPAHARAARMGRGSRRTTRSNAATAMASSSWISRARARARRSSTARCSRPASGRASIATRASRTACRSFPTPQADATHASSVKHDHRDGR
jgi:nitrate/TMAO reductase-like tetraheme cytochrome c subunit